MNPQAFLRTYWRTELRPQVFVAMSFDERYRRRYDDVFVPAVGALKRGDDPLRAVRVDERKTGDSILTDIVDGIAHSELVLADVSTIGKDSVSSKSYRNANVMYEVGIALACRQPCEVILVRDDRDEPFLFDLSTVPCRTMDFTDAARARGELVDDMLARLGQRALFRDARMRIAVSTMTPQETSDLVVQPHLAVRAHQAGGSRRFGCPEGADPAPLAGSAARCGHPNRRLQGPAEASAVVLLEAIAEAPGGFWPAPAPTFGNLLARGVSIPRLLDKGLIEFTWSLEDQQAGYHLTPFGRSLVEAAKAIEATLAQAPEGSTQSTEAPPAT